MNKKSVISAILILQMALLTPLSVSASTIGDYTDGIDLNGKHYYDIGYQGEFDDQRSLLMAAIKKDGLDDQWNGAAYMALADKIDELKFDADTQRLRTYMNHMCGETDGDGTDGFAVTVWGKNDLNYAPDAWTALDEAENFVYKRADALWKPVLPGFPKPSKSALVNSDVKDAASTEANPTLYETSGFLVLAEYDESREKSGHYLMTTVLYNNFRMTPVLSEDIGTGTATASKTSQDQLHVEGGYSNLSSETVLANQSLSKSLTETVENEVNGTDTYSFSESVSISTTVSMGFLFASTDITTTFGMSAEQAFSSGWSQNVANSVQTTSTTAASVNMPGHTGLVLGETIGDVVLSNSYDCPVALSYDVTIVVHALDPGKTNAEPISKVLTTFNGDTSTAKDAAEDFVQRRILKYYDKDQIDWNAAAKIMDKAWDEDYDDRYSTDETLSNTLNGNVPMSVTGGTMTYKQRGSETKIHDIYPLYPLSTVELTADNTEYNMLVGDSLVVDNIGLAGYNAEGVSYYGFRPKQGHWELVDENQTPIAASEAGSLQVNPVTGTTKLVADNPGTAYLKYVINDQLYSSASNLEEYASDDTIQTAYIQVNIDSKPFAGRVAVNGSIEGYVNDPAINLDTLDTISYMVYDETDMGMANAPVEWQIQEPFGAVIDDNNLTFTQEGTYHLRALYQGQWSDWITAEALPQKQINDLIIADDITTPSVLADVEFTGSNSVDLDGLSVAASDQYGFDWTVADLAFMTTDQSGSVTIDPTTNEATITAPGTYEFYAIGDGVESNRLSISLYNTYPVTYQPASYGTITVTDLEGNEIPSGTPLREGTDIIVNATPVDSYELKELLVNGTPVNSGETMMVNEPLDISAGFFLKLKGWQNINNNWYYYSSEGVKQYGWQFIKNNWYYLGNRSTDGAMQIGWQKIYGKWYYLSKSKNDGAMKIGWQTIYGKRYYLSSNKNDGAMRTSWQRIAGNWYYFGKSKNDGAMKVGRQYIDGRYYYFSKDVQPIGHLLNIRP